jgi:TP901 family phage tail tape measure protein
LAKECGNASGQTAGLRGALTDAFGGLGSYLARFASSYYLISKTIQGVKKMVSAVKEVDTSLVELQKVTNLTGSSLNSFTEKAYQAGANLGRTGQEVIDATTTFSRAGYDLQEAAQLAQSALVMTNVGVDIPNIESAASDMISILKAFDVQAEESMSVIDKLYNVANKEPLDFGNLTEMLVTAGGTLAQTGTTLEQTMGLLTGAFATMRDTSVANG